MLPYWYRFFLSFSHTMLHVFFPTRQRFAKAFLKALANAGVEITLYDPEAFRVKTKSHGEYFLHNFHDEFTHLSFRRRWSYLPAFIDSQIVNRREMSKDWSQDRQFILPTVKHKVAFDQLSLRAELDAGKPVKTNQQIVLLGSSMYQMLCFDYPTMMIFSLEYDPQEEHKVSHKQAWDAAISNLWDKSKEDWRQILPGTWISPWQDNQDPARLGLPGLIRQLKVTGDPIALTVHRDMLFITGSQDPAGIQAILQIATEQLEIPRSGRCPMLRLTDQDTWVDFAPPANDPVYAAVTAWNDIARALDYQETQELVTRVIKHRGEDTDVLPVKVIHDNDANRDFVVTTWDDAQPGLLPYAPIVAFVKSGKLIGFASWANVLRHAGTLLEKIQIQPEYWRITGFPDDARLALMNANLDTSPWDIPR